MSEPLTNETTEYATPAEAAPVAPQSAPLLSADAILGVDDKTTADVDVPEWGGVVRVRALTGDERDGYEASMTVEKGDRLERNPIGARARLVVRACVDAEGNRLFRDNQAPQLGQKNAAVLDRLWDKIADLSGMTTKAVEAAEGNSDAVPSDGSTSA